MNNTQLIKRINDLSEKLKPVPSEGIRIDFDSFTDPEKYIFLKTAELIQKYEGKKLPPEFFIENKELFRKVSLIALERTSELFLFIVPLALEMDEVEQWFFKLHFGLFMKKFKDCLQNVKKWSKEDREEFLCEMNRKPKEDNEFKRRK
jgi:hypothetical protein